MENTLHTKHCAIQSQLNAPKDAFNPFGKYKYRSAESILAAAKPLLQEHSLTLTLNDSVIAVGERIYIKATAPYQTAQTPSQPKPTPANPKAKKAQTKAKSQAQPAATPANTPYADYSPSTTTKMPMPPTPTASSLKNPLS